MTLTLARGTCGLQPPLGPSSCISSRFFLPLHGSWFELFLLSWKAFIALKKIKTNWPEDHILVTFALDSWQDLKRKRNHMQSTRDNAVTSYRAKAIFLQEAGQVILKWVCERIIFFLPVWNKSHTLIARQEKFKPKKSLPFGILSPLTVHCIYALSITRPPHGQDYLLICREQHFPSISKTLLGRQHSFLSL